MKITLATLPQATAQQVFEQVATHLLTQHRQSTLSAADDPDSGEELTCRYRGDDGCKCAAGCLMDDSEYHKEFETKRWATLANMGAVPSTHAALIQDLQTIHDRQLPQDWLESLRVFARERYLDARFLSRLMGGAAA